MGILLFFFRIHFNFLTINNQYHRIEYEGIAAVLAQNSRHLYFSIIAIFDFDSEKVYIVSVLLVLVKDRVVNNTSVKQTICDILSVF
ncbi:hypothetical protein AS202_16250 [Myroides odoratimimus]|uniref:Uncharacterized protein n=1 Tax=Myroides odoratimimus TaxID=76832 RepID=A0AAI8C7V0_9FLAO|nr:hypothetical protein AS202_16250 [Myroides odoratimimus]